MKLLFAIKHLDSAAGGAERVLCTICSDLAERGHDVSIVTFDQLDGVPFYKLHEDIRLINLAIGDATGPSGVAETLKRVAMLRGCVANERPDVAIGFMHSMFIPLAFAAMGTGVPALGSEHIVPEHYSTRRFQFFLLKFAARFLKKITVVSESIRKTYPSGVMAKMVVMPNPIKRPVALGGIPSRENGWTILNVGRLDEQKDQATLIKAFGQISDDFPDWNLKIVGTGPLHDELRNLIDAMGLGERVILGGVTSEIDREYQAADLFVISSTYEAFGLVTAEAMSHGLPVIGFADCPGTNELIQDGDTGILVNPKGGRFTELAAVLAKLMRDPALQAQLGTRGKLAIEKNFSSTQVSDRWENLLASFADKRRDYE